MKNKIQIDLNVTNNCNFRCRHCCFNSGVLKMEEMTLPFVRKVLKEFKELGGEKVDFTGGEPMLNKNILPMIRFGSKLGLRTKIVSNGSLLNADKLAELKKAGLWGLSVSIDGSTYKKFNLIRPVHSKVYQNVIKTIKTSVILGLYTKINTVVFKQNIDDIENIIKQAIKLGVQEVRFCFFTPQGRGLAIDSFRASPVEWLKKIRTTLKKYDKQIKIVFGLSMIEKNKKINTSCLIPDSYMLQILPDGGAYPCVLFAAEGKSIVNLNEVSLKKLIVVLCFLQHILIRFHNYLPLRFPHIS